MAWVAPEPASPWYLRTSLLNYAFTATALLDYPDHYDSWSEPKWTPLSRARIGRKQNDGNDGKHLFIIEFEIPNNWWLFLCSEAVRTDRCTSSFASSIDWVIASSASISGTHFIQSFPVLPSPPSSPALQPLPSHHYTIMRCTIIPCSFQFLLKLRYIESSNLFYYFWVKFEYFYENFIPTKKFFQIRNSFFLCLEILGTKQTMKSLSEWNKIWLVITVSIHRRIDCFFIGWKPRKVFNRFRSNCDFVCLFLWLEAIVEKVLHLYPVFVTLFLVMQSSFWLDSCPLNTTLFLLLIKWKLKHIINQTRDFPT